MQLNNIINEWTSPQVYKKGEYTAVEVGDTNYYTLLYKGRAIMNSRGERYSLCFIRDMGFEKVLLTNKTDATD